MKKNKKSLQIGLGVSSILMIFVVLCMMILSLLSYHEAKQKETITLRAQSFQEAYATADAQMQLVIQEMKAKQMTSLAQIQGKQEIIELLQKADITMKIDEQTLVLTMPIHEKQCLEATLVLQERTLATQAYVMKENGV